MIIRKSTWPCLGLALRSKLRYRLCNLIFHNFQRKQVILAIDKINLTVIRKGKVLFQNSDFILEFNSF